MGYDFRKPLIGEESLDFLRLLILTNLESQWPIIMGYFLWATLRYGPVFFG